MGNEVVKIPTIQELMVETDESIKNNALMVILNQPPPATWLYEHPSATTKNAKGETVPARYLPIERVEYLLSRIFGKWRVEILREGSIANSCYVVARVHVTNPLTNKDEYQDGIGASPMQTDKGKGAMEWNFVKSAAVMMALPSAETYAIKDACEKWGKIFGKDLNRKDIIDYNTLLKKDVNIDDLRGLFMEVEHLLTEPDKDAANEIISTQDTKRYTKLYTQLIKLKPTS